MPCPVPTLTYAIARRLGEHERIELWAIVTGHGNSTNSCAEFCNHQHEFKVNGTPFLKEHKEAGTDGEPDNPKAVMQAIIDASRRMDRDSELAVLMLQVGTDERATRFLKALDDDLVRVGARFDICDTITMLEMEDTPLADVLRNAIFD